MLFPPQRLQVEASLSFWIQPSPLLVPISLGITIPYSTIPVRITGRATHLFAQGLTLTPPPWILERTLRHGPGLWLALIPSSHPLHPLATLCHLHPSIPKLKGHPVSTHTGTVVSPLPKSSSTIIAPDFPSLPSISLSTAIFSTVLRPCQLANLTS